MYVTIGESPELLDEEIRSRLERLSFPTLGHYLEEGFLAPEMRRIVGRARVIGTAVTVRTTATDSTMLHHAAGEIRPGEVLVLDTGGDTRHAPLGEVVAAQLVARGAAGAVVDGVITDTDEITEMGLTVYARGTSVLTTKLHDIDAGGLNVPVSVGGVSVRPGDLILGDANGVLAAPVETVAAILDYALDDDAEEPELLEAIRAGRPLGSLTGATESIRKHLASREP